MPERKFWTSDKLLRLIAVLVLPLGSLLCFWKASQSVRQGNSTEITGSAAWTGIAKEFNTDFAAIIEMCPSAKVCASQQPALAKASVIYNSQGIAFIYIDDKSALIATNYGLANETSGDEDNGAYVAWGNQSVKTEAEALSSGHPVFVYLQSNLNDDLYYAGMHVGGMSAEQLEQVAAEFVDQQ